MPQQPESKIYVAILGRFLYNYKCSVHDYARAVMRDVYTTQHTLHKKDGGYMNCRLGFYHKYWAFWVLGFILCGLFCDKSVQIVHAEETRFDVEARLLPSDGDIYDIQLTIKNCGEDWEGTVQLLANGTPKTEIYDCAYDIQLSLPQESIKQFVTHVPKKSIKYVENPFKIVFWDNQSQKTEEKQIRRLLTDGSSVLSMGILSDAYSALTYLDMGGRELAFERAYFPIKLKQLNRDTLAGELDKLTFLVIDQYDTAVLPYDTVYEITKWIYDGGILFVGTGSYAEDTLKGLGNLKMDVTKICKPGENKSAQTYNLDLHKLPIAELNDRAGMYYMNNRIQAYIDDWGDGALGILPYALSELGSLDASAYQNNSTQQDFTELILDEVSKAADSRFRKSSEYNPEAESSYTFDRFFNMFGNSNQQLHFGLLGMIVAAYVIFVGPVLYMILKHMGKRDYYWLAVPATTLAGIVLIYFAGRGFEVADTKVYSMSVRNLAEQDYVTYMHCYDAKHREWKLQLSEQYAAVGPLVGIGYENSNKEGYYHHIRQEGDRLLFGIVPNTSFEDSFFVAEGAKQTINGTIQSAVEYGEHGIYGTVANQTVWDFAYFAVIYDDMLYIYKDLPSGESCDLGETKKVFSGTGYTEEPGEAYLYRFLMDFYDQDLKKDLDSIAALGAAVEAVYTDKNRSKTMVFGVTKDWDKAVDGNCNETAFGCVYVIQ